MRVLANLLAGVGIAIISAGALVGDTSEQDTGLRLKRMVEATQTGGPMRLVQAYDCSNVSCKRLRSCDEACYKLQVCGQQIRDRDKDGIPCENLCSRPCP